MGKIKMKPQKEKEGKDFRFRIECKDGNVDIDIYGCNFEMLTTIATVCQEDEVVRDIIMQVANYLAITKIKNIVDDNKDLLKELAEESL